MVGNEESVTVAVHIEAADRVFAAKASDDEMPRLHLHELTAFGQTVERRLQLRSGRAPRAKLTNKLLERCARMGQARDVLQNGGVGHLEQL